MFPRLGSSVAQLSVVPVRWMHPQEVSHLDTHTAPGYIQTVGPVCVCSTRTVYSITEHSWLMIMMIMCVLWCSLFLSFSLSIYYLPLCLPSIPPWRSKAVGVHESARWGCVWGDHAAGWCIRLTSVWGLGGHPPSDTATDLCAHLYWYRNQVSRYAGTA